MNFKGKLIYLIEYWMSYCRDKLIFIKNNFLNYIQTNMRYKLLNYEVNIDFQPLQHGDVLVSFADIDKSIKKLNYNPKIDIESGIPLFIDRYTSYTSR